MAEDRHDGGKGKDRRESQNEGDPVENGFDEQEPDFSDAEDYVDDASEDELLGDFLRKRPKETDGIDSVIVVDNVPEVGSERLDKLQNVLRKIFSKFGKIVNEHYPKENNRTKSYIFLEFQNPQEAAEAVKATNGHKLDKQHTFCVNLFSDFDKYMDIPDEWEQPPPQPFHDHGNLRSWQMDKDCQDQYSVIYEGGEKTAIYRNDPGEPSQVDSRARWTETYVRWSPQGTYLATFHQRGVALWGGADFKQIIKFSHPGVQLIDFSPCERYMVTFSPLPDNQDDPQAIIIWDLMTGQKKRGFHCENASIWPIFKWTHNGQYLARKTGDGISIYETPSFGLLDKKSVRVKDIKEFAWSPTDSIISYWTPEEQNTPARVTLIKIPSREQICVKNLFTVAECKMHWQKSGDYLCVKVDRYRAKKEEKEGPKYSGIFHNLNIFRLREKQVPVDILDIKEKHQTESISAFAWEPTGHKFAFIHGESPRVQVTFYSVKGGNVEHLKTLEKRQANFLFWSPNGQFIVLAGLRSMSGVLEFVDTSDMTIMAQTEHFMATDVEWDPTGRFVATAVSWWGHKVDNAYWLFNFQGKLLHKQALERFCQLLWRPRPPTLLSIQQIRDLKKNMKKYSATFSLEDKMRQSMASKEQVEQRRSQIQEYEHWREELDMIYRTDHDQRISLRNGLDTDSLDERGEEEEKAIEFLISIDEILLEE